LHRLSLLFHFLRNLVPEGSGLGLFRTQALRSLFQIPAIPAVEGAAMDAYLLQSLTNRKLRVFYDPDDLQFF
jgi:hypothetical protein